MWQYMAYFAPLKIIRLSSTFSSTTSSFQHQHLHLLFHPTSLTSLRAYSTYDAQTSASARFQHPYTPNEVEHKWQRKWQLRSSPSNPNRKSNLKSSCNSTSYTRTTSSIRSHDEKAFYVLAMFPYPSGILHMGHARVYTISDVIARAYRLAQYQVLYPMGWDAFGLPAENAAIERGIEPSCWTLDNIKHMKMQMISMGFSFDWAECELATCHPKYYRWTQWLFLALFRAGLAYQKQSLVNWDPVDQTVLANEQVDSTGKSWRSSAAVEKKWMKQWHFKISHYVEPLLNDLNQLQGKWPDSVIKMQREWIGKVQGLFVEFQVVSNTIVHHHDLPVVLIKVLTTRPEMLLACTFIFLHLDYPDALQLVTPDRRHDLGQWIEEQRREQHWNRADDKASAAASDDPSSPPSHDPSPSSSSVKISSSNIPAMNGFLLDVEAIHPLTKERLPVYVAKYVDTEYGVYARMAVPAHHSLDWDFAQCHQLCYRCIFEPNPTMIKAPKEVKLPLIVPDDELDQYRIIHDLFYAGLPVKTAASELIELGIKEQWATWETRYKLRDWLISRQRRWGTPIPIIHCPRCGPVAIPESQLPVELPPYHINSINRDQLQRDYHHVDSQLNSKPTSNSSDKEMKMKEWLNCQCPQCGRSSTRETDTMDTFVDSTWYYLRYLDVNNDVEPFSKTLAEKWLPVDIYVGGIEHAILHLLYSRFICKFLSQFCGLPISEPFSQLLAQGMVHNKTYRMPLSNQVVPANLVEDFGEDGARLKATDQSLVVRWEKMSKSKHNGIDPMEAVSKYGADTIRLYLLFKAPVEQVLDWDVAQIQGQLRWLRRIWTLVQMVANCRMEIGVMTPIGQDKQESSALVDSSNLAQGDNNNCFTPLVSLPWVIQLETKVNETILEVTHDIFELQTFNKAISRLMTLSNLMWDLVRCQQTTQEKEKCQKDPIPMDFKASLSSQPYPKVLTSSTFEWALKQLLILLSPMAPHFSSEAWEMLHPIPMQGKMIRNSETLNDGQDYIDIFDQVWPVCRANSYGDATHSHQSDSTLISVHIGGKHRMDLNLDLNKIETNEQIREMLQRIPKLDKYLHGMQIKRVIYILDKKIINLVVEKGQ